MSREDRAAETPGHLFGGGEAHGRLTGGAGAYGPAVVVFLYQLLQERRDEFPRLEDKKP